MYNKSMDDFLVLTGVSISTCLSLGLWVVSMQVSTQESCCWFHFRAGPSKGQSRKRIPCLLVIDVARVTCHLTGQWMDLSNYPLHFAKIILRFLATYGLKLPQPLFLNSLGGHLHLLSPESLYQRPVFGMRSLWPKRKHKKSMLKPFLCKVKEPQTQ